MEAERNREAYMSALVLQFVCIRRNNGHESWKCFPTAVGDYVQLAYNLVDQTRNDIIIRELDIGNVVKKLSQSDGLEMVAIRERTYFKNPRQFHILEGTSSQQREPTHMS